MPNVKRALGQRIPLAPISREMFEGTGPALVEFRK